MQDKNISQSNFENCVKCSLCTAYCPVLAVNPDYPGPKAAGPDLERYRLKNKEFFTETLKYCLNCKRCEIACPSGVHIGDIIQRARLQYSEKRPSFRDRILANTDIMGSLASPLAPVVNLATSLGVTKTVMDATLKIDHRRTFPKYSSEKFESWFKKYPQPQGLEKAVNYFHGCFVQYNFPSLGKDFVKVANALGYRVDLLDNEKCCGVAMIASGLKEHALSNARHNIKIIAKASENGKKKTVSTSSTCTFTIKDEYGNILGLDNSEISQSMDLASRFIYNVLTEEGGLQKLKFKENLHLNIAYHTPCHLERLGWGVYSIELLKLIPGINLKVLDSNCCGIAGTYGFKKENYETSQAIGAPLFRQISELNPDYVACDCETCRWQIEMSTPYKVIHPITLLAMAIE